MGLQGSWLRGEAHENSDIDIMVILDGFSVRDIRCIPHLCQNMILLMKELWCYVSQTKTISCL